MKRFLLNLYYNITGQYHKLIWPEVAEPKWVGRPEEPGPMFQIEYEGQRIYVLDADDLKEHMMHEIIERMEVEETAELRISFKNVLPSEMENVYEFDGY